VIFVVASVVLQLLLGLLVALTLHRGLKARSARRDFHSHRHPLLPGLFGSVGRQYVWQLMLNEAEAMGSSTACCRLMGIRPASHGLSDPDIAIWSQCLQMSGLRGTAFSMILLYAGSDRLIPASLYEAGRGRRRDRLRQFCT